MNRPCEISRILVINPGAVSTKLALFSDAEEIWSEQIYHPEEELADFPHVADEEDYRYEAICASLEEEDVSQESLSAVVGRGGLIRPVSGGTYTVNEQLAGHLREGYQGEHASNLGGLLAIRIAAPLGIPSYIVDPVAVDEMHDLARYSGLDEIKRRSLAHTLNLKAVCREVLGERYLRASLVVVHLGSGVSVTAHENGRMIDVNNAIEQGPFGTERTGGLPVIQLVEWTLQRHEEGHDASSIQRLLTGSGGLYSYLGTKNLIEIEERIAAGDERAEQVLQALAYQVSKEIGSMCAVLKGQAERIIITGGMAHSDRLVQWIQDYVSSFAPVTVVPGEREMEALALGALRVLRGEEEAREYQ